MSDFSRLAPVFTYPILREPGSIRLLQISINPRTTTLEGLLINATLGKAPCYQALSYVWGDRNAADPYLSLGSGVVRIRSNLFKLLINLARDGGNSLFWADQVCIDQDNESEQSGQVALMSNIFSQAQKIVGWLGPSTAETDLALKVSRVLGLTMLHSQSSELHQACFDLAATGYLRVPSVDLFNPGGPCWKAVTAVAQMEWFERLWIVQEAVLARKLEIRCGQARVDGDVFFTAVKALSLTSTQPPNPALLEPFRNALTMRQLRLRIHSHESLQLHDPSYLPLLSHTFSAWRCTMNQDRLNALYGVAFAQDALTKELFRPRYDVPENELYRGFAKGHVNSTKTLDILHFSGCGDSDAFILSREENEVQLNLAPPTNDIPTWVPDWRVRSRPLLLLGAENQPSSFSATSSAPDYQFCSLSGQLRVRALEVDEVVYCGIPYCDKVLASLNNNIDQIILSWHELAQSMLGTDMCEATFASTLLMDAKVRLTHLTEVMIEQAKITDYFKHWKSRYFMEQTGTYTFHPSEPIDASGDGIDQAAHFAYQAEEVCRNRTFFITKNGRMGLGSTIVAPGDSIVLIHGLKTPFIVQRGGRDLCRGESYIHGLMHREFGVSSEDTYLTLA